MKTSFIPLDTLWPAFSKKEEIRQEKLKMTDTELLSNCPVQMLTILAHIRQGGRGNMLLCPGDNTEFRD